VKRAIRTAIPLYVLMVAASFVCLEVRSRWRTAAFRKQVMHVLLESRGAHFWYSADGNTLPEVATSVSPGRRVFGVVYNAGWTTEWPLDGIETLSEIESLCLSRVVVGESGVKEIGKLTRLDTLVINRGGVKDADLDNFRGMARLQHLSLLENPITDFGLTTLTALKSLEDLDVRATSVTTEGVTAFRKVRPDVNVLFTSETAR